MSVQNSLESIIQKLVHESDPEEVKRQYKLWANTYEKDLQAYGYVAPDNALDLLTRCIQNKAVHVHDAGCGTGLVGVKLQSLGFKNVSGSDFSPDMLKLARQSGAYTHLKELDFSAPTPLLSDSIDAIVSVGVYTKRFKNSFIGDMVRVLKPDGYFVFTARPLYFDEVSETIHRLLKSECIRSSYIEYNDYMTGQNASAYFIALQKSTLTT